MNARSYKSNIVILLASAILFGLFSVWLGKELCWDLANYHYYIPFAFIHQRYHQDFWPTSYIHQYLNPTIDLLSYFLITNINPLLSEFILGAIHGINFWLLYMIACCFLDTQFHNHTPNPQSVDIHLPHHLMALTIAFLGMYGPYVLTNIGSFQNDNLISLFILLHVLMITKALHTYNRTCKNKWTNNTYYYLFISGILLGIGIGLKLTAGIFLIGTIFTALVLPLPIVDKIKITATLSISIGLGMLITSGYWMLLMWHEHSNPFFPFLNGIFHSTEFIHANWYDNRFMPHGVMQTLFYPFFFSWNGQASDIATLDFRYPIIYVLLLLLALSKILPTHNLTHQMRKLRLDEYWLIVFFLMTYICWQYVFSIARYIVSLEMLAPLIIYVLLKQLVLDYTKFLISLTVIYTFIMFTMLPMPVVRDYWRGNSFFNIVMPEFVVKSKDQTMVLTPYSAFAFCPDPRPQFYLIPFFPPHWRFVGIPFLYTKYYAEDLTTNHIRLLINQFHGKLFLLTAEFSLAEAYKALGMLGLKRVGPCEYVYSDRQAISHQNVLLCPMAKVATQ